MKLHLGSLLLGLCGLAVAAAVTLIAYDRQLPWNVLAIGVPATLVVVGLLGMFSARGRT